MDRCEDIRERTEMETGYLMRREPRDIQTKIKEEEDWEKRSVKIEREDGMRDEGGVGKEEEKEKDEQREVQITHQVGQTDKLLTNGVKSEQGLQEGEELSSLVTSCLLKQPRVLIPKLQISNFSVSVSSLHPPEVLEKSSGSDVSMEMP